MLHMTGRTPRRIFAQQVRVMRFDGRSRVTLRATGVGRVRPINACGIVRAGEVQQPRQAIAVRIQRHPGGVAFSAAMLDLGMGSREGRR